MIKTGKELVMRFKNQWQMLRWLEVMLYALGPALLTYAVFQNILFAGIVFFFCAVLFSLWIKPWKIDLKKTSNYIDSHLETAQYSSDLLLASAENLSGIALLQREKVFQELQAKLASVKKEHHLGRAALFLVLSVVTAFFIAYFGWNFSPNPTEASPQSKQIIFQNIDFTETNISTPVLDSLRVIINYPKYTNQRPFLAAAEKIKALEGSRISWQLYFNSKIDSAKLDLFRCSESMNRIEKFYTASAIVEQSGFYSIKFSDTLGTWYSSPLFPIEISEDQPPVLEVQGLDQFVEFDYSEEKKLPFTVYLGDDFGLAKAEIIATVSRGSGENIKFRELRLPFEKPIQKEVKTANLTKTIYLDQLDMEPGDELYFYVETQDTKVPKANVARSETYFAVIKDTITTEFAMSSGMGADVMPDYFRSQRQLIIDTEKLIKNRPKLSEKEFNDTSNELGAEQKALRLKYGRFMGDEAESGIHIQTEMPTGDDGQNADPLAGYTHDHDAGGEHNHDQDVATPSAKTEMDGQPEDPLGEYVHNHDDPEESTFFALSLKSKLRRALNEMWDAELHLRLNTPQKSLPFQHRALELLQEIKNSARIYVHRIGFDPPPIKEDKRLTGKLDEVRLFQKRRDPTTTEKQPNMREAVEKLQQRLNSGNIFSEVDQQTFEKAGDELAALAIEKPGQYLRILEVLKGLSLNRNPSIQQIREALFGLIQALPNPETQPGKTNKFIGDLNSELLKELQHD